MSDHELGNQPDDHFDGQFDEHLDVDSRARRAGAELRRPAPADLVSTVRRARRRQQSVRAGVGAVGVAAIIGLGAVVLNGGGEGGTLVPASVPDSTLSTVTPVTTVVPATSTIPATTAGVHTPTVPASTPDSPVAMTTLAPAATPPTVAPIGTDADGVPDAIYAFANTDLSEQHVIDPITLEVIETRPAAFVPADEPVTRVSASGAVQYPTVSDLSAESDACGQFAASDWVTGTDPTGLPERLQFLRISPNGRVGVVLSRGCAGDGSSGDVTVSVFDADRPDIAARPLLVADETVEVVFLPTGSLSDDGSYLIVGSYEQPLAEGIAARIRVFDTATGELVADNATDAAAEYPRVDCTDEFLWPQFVGSTAIAYGALCPDGIAVVIRDLVTGESIDVLNVEYAGRTYETMVSATLSVDRLTYRDPGSAWYLLCAERETRQGDTLVIGADGSNPCWIGRGAEPMRELPTATTVAAGFQPFG